ncbi:uncharacterized protein BCR38DRAFT_411835 [Pseudomassariella vexata]|uniref:Secreted protein n=1 Tax=Pseudomassariella vexata TaxID=1141098 RepID=A0A1Y2DN76_9PEZI|nr:uncharacterized protein BCR38DRAFT_411835 [Pseudomassariella vexata]ORY60711.1 hypothetical protein BCR38DRAFT_411835 [Pseudomassariella vexata]
MKFIVLVAAALVTSCVSVSSSCSQANATVCSLEYGGVVHPSTCIGQKSTWLYDYATCYDLPSEWTEGNGTLTPATADAVCYAQMAPCSAVSEDTSGEKCEDTPDCSGSIMLTMSNPIGWNLGSYGLRPYVKSFACYPRGNPAGKPLVPTATSSLTAAGPTSVNSV